MTFPAAMDATSAADRVCLVGMGCTDIPVGTVTYTGPAGEPGDTRPICEYHIGLVPHLPGRHTVVRLVESAGAR